MVTNIHGNSNSTRRSSNLADNEKPSISISDVSGSADAGQCSAHLNIGRPSVSDNCGVESVSNDAPAAFPVGSTIVHWMVTDIHGNSNSATQIVNVADNEKP